jgi:alpha-mannosidase
MGGRASGAIAKAIARQREALRRLREPCRVEEPNGLFAQGSSPQGTLTRRNILNGALALFAGALFGRLPRPFGALAHSQPAIKRIYIAPDDHTDYFWSADGAAYQQAILEMLDYYLDLADTTASEPPQFQSRWNCDCSMWLWTYEKNRSSAQFLRLIERIRDGHITVPLNPAVLCYGASPIEAILRGMYYCGHIERRHGLRLILAIAMENQTLPCGLASLFAGAGAKYSWKGICGCASKVPNAWDREHDIYWWRGPDGRRVLLKWNSMLNGNQGPGGYAEAYNPAAVVDYVSSNTTFASRYPYEVIGMFGKGWDNLMTLTDEFVSVAKTKTNAARQVRVSNQIDFFEDFKAVHGSGLPSQTCSFGNEWDTYPASMAEVTARVKRSTEKLRAAESLAVLVSLKNSSFMQGRTEARNTAWMNLGLYWEHGWTADGPVSRQDRAVWQRMLAAEIETYVDTLHADAAAALGSMIEKSGTNLRFYVYNPLSWTRTEAADFPYSGTGPLKVVDLSTGTEVPSQIVMVNGARFLRVLASGVPPVGYKVFEVRPKAGRIYTDAATVSGSVISNSFFRITMNSRGAISSLIDLTQGNWQFAKSVGGRLLNDLGSGWGTVQVENAGPASVTLAVECSGRIPHASRLTLIRNCRRIELDNEILGNFDEVLTWGFGFNLLPPSVMHEEVGAVILAKLLSQGGHYSPRNARYDWLTLNHFADITNGSVGVTLSNADCCFFKLGASSIGTLDTVTPQITVLAGGQVDGPGLGIQAQGGDERFIQRFALRTHGSWSRSAAMRFALEHQNPLVTAQVTGGNAYPEASFSFLTISNPSVLLWALKPAEEGIWRGITARVWNLAQAAADCVISSPLGAITTARETTHLETAIRAASISNGSIQCHADGQKMMTYLFTLGG